MSITIFPTPISGSDKEAPVLILGVVHSDGFNPWFLVVDSDGKVTTAYPDTLRLDLRYDWSRQIWVDVSGEVGEPETPDHGSETVSRHLPELDGAGGGDPSDGEDGATGGLDPSETEG